MAYLQPVKICNGIDPVNPVKKNYIYMCYMELYSLFCLQILIAGDKKGNIVAFPFHKTLAAHNSSGTQQKIPFCDRFKGAHGISSVTSVHITTSISDDAQIHTVCPDFCCCSIY
jgi:hypothetical protein